MPTNPKSNPPLFHLPRHWYTECEGQTCTCDCGANWFECTCGGDWTDRETYRLREALNKVYGLINVKPLSKNNDDLEIEDLHYALEQILNLHEYLTHLPDSLNLPRGASTVNRMQGSTTN